MAAVKRRAPAHAAPAREPKHRVVITHTSQKAGSCSAPRPAESTQHSEPGLSAFSAANRPPTRRHRPRQVRSRRRARFESRESEGASPRPAISPPSWVGHSLDSSHHRTPWRICSDFDRPVRAVIDESFSSTSGSTMNVQRFFLVTPICHSSAQLECHGGRLRWRDGVAYVSAWTYATRPEPPHVRAPAVPGCNIARPVAFDVLLK